MGILAVGGEVDTYETVSGHTAASTTTSGRFLSTVSRSAMLVQSGVSEIYRPFAGAPTDFWVHFCLFLVPETVVDAIVLENAGGTTGSYRIGVNADKSWTIYKYKSGAWTSLVSTTAAVAVLDNARADIDIHIVTSASGSIVLYKDTNIIATYTGDTTVDAAPARLRFKGNATSTNYFAVSQLVISTLATLNMKLATLIPTANSGTNAQWDFGYDKVNTVDPVGGNFIQATDINKVTTFPSSDLDGSLSDYVVKGVAVASRVSIDTTSSITDVKAAVFEGSTTYLAAAAMGITKDGAVHPGQTIFETNPSTTAAWTIAEVNAAEFGLKSV